MTTMLVRLWDRYDDEIYIRVPVGKPKRKRAEVKQTVMERVILWWARMKAEVQNDPA